MSDYNSSLPIRTENAGDAIVKVADATIPSQQLKVESDGSINVNAAFAPGTEVKITDGTDTLDINADGSLNAVVTATNLDIRDLAFATDKVDVSGSSVTATVSATDLDIRDLVFATDKVDASGSTVALDAPTLAALESITVQNGSGASAVNIQDGGNSITVDATALDIRAITHASDSIKVGDGTDFLAVNSDGSINVIVSNDVPGAEVSDYHTSASVAANASVNHDYTVTTGETLTLEEVIVSGSGKIKAQVLINGNVKIVAFNSTSSPTIILPALRMLKATSTQVVRITITNKDNQAQDVYSTLLGTETP